MTASVNIVRLAVAFVIFGFCIMFAFIAASANWADEQLMNLAEYIAPH